MATKVFLLLFSLILLQMSCKQASNPDSSLPTKSESLFDKIVNTPTVYDSSFAKALQADQYGMHPYVMAFLKKGPNRDQDSTTAAQLQKAHLDNIIRMAEAGKLVLAGPFLDNGDVRGIYIFNVATVAEAQALTSTDPAIMAGRLAMELHPWYGSATLPLINPLHKRLEKNSVAK